MVQCKTAMSGRIGVASLPKVAASSPGRTCDMGRSTVPDSKNHLTMARCFGAPFCICSWVAAIGRSQVDEIRFAGDTLPKGSISVIPMPRLPRYSLARPRHVEEQGTPQILRKTSRLQRRRNEPTISMSASLRRASAAVIRRTVSIKPDCVSARPIQPCGQI